MFVPFLKKKEYQEFRKHIGKEYIIANTAIKTFARQLIPFQFITTNFGEVTRVDVVKINSMGLELERHQLKDDYITSVDVGDGEWRIQCSGGVLGTPIQYNLFYLEVFYGEDIRYSEVFCRIREVATKGKILLKRFS